MILIFTTIGSKATAYKIGRKLLEEKLIACYNLTQVESSYWWDDKITSENEFLMIIKTKEENFGKIESYLKENSGFDVPEIVAVRPEKVNQPYLDWIERETGGN